MTGTAGRDRSRRSRRTTRAGPDDPHRSSAAHERFLRLDRERATREWRRYEGTAQRDLFRQLRERFLARNVVDGRWALDAGSGPGRFLSMVGGPGSTRVALDLSTAMLAVGRELVAKVTGPLRLAAERVRGDALRPPFRPGSFSEVALVGNALGFEGPAGVDLLDTAEGLLAPGGRLIVEVAPGSGERSRYLTRLPVGAVRRLLAAPVPAIVPRVLREGFASEPARHRPVSFRRWTASELLARWKTRDWSVKETMAVAPALGQDTARVSEVSRDPRAWAGLLELEEQLGHEPSRWTNAAAVLLAAGPSATAIPTPRRAD